MFIGASKKSEVKYPQLTLAKLAQSGKHQNGSQGVLGSILTRGNFFLLKLFFFSLRKQYKK